LCENINISWSICVVREASRFNGHAQPGLVTRVRKQVVLIGNDFLTIGGNLENLLNAGQHLMRLYLLAASMIVLAGCADQAPKTPSGEVANGAVGSAAGDAQAAAQQRALEDFKSCAMRPTSYEQFTCLNEIDSGSRNSAN
jgi:hypothetical protein